MNTQIQNVQFVCYKYKHSFFVLSRSFVFVYTYILTYTVSMADMKCMINY